MARACLTFLFLLGAASCSRQTGREPALLHAGSLRTLLDSAQAAAVCEHARVLPEGTQIALCILRGDSECYAGAVRDNDSLVAVNNSDSVFEIGSITKTFTGTMLAQLILDGTVRPDDPVQKYLPVTLRESTRDGRAITLLELADHTSGLPFEPTNIRGRGDSPFDPYNPYGNYTTELLYEYLSRQVVLQSTPGERRLYSNLGGGLLGHVLTLVSKKSYEQLLQETVCRPLGMRATSVERTQESQHRMVHGRDLRGNVLPFGVGDCGPLTGAGGIASSVRDLVRYVRANIADTGCFALAQKPTRRFDEHFSGGLGWAPYSEGNLDHMGAFGATGGFTSGLIFERHRRVAVIVLTNVSAFVAPEQKPVESLCRALYDPLVNAAVQ